MDNMKKTAATNSPKRKYRNEVLCDHGDWLEIDVSTPKYPDAIMKINKENWNRISTMDIGRIFCIHCGKGRNTNYAGYCELKQKNGNKLVHRLIIVAKQVDHINHDGLDNRLENLRECTVSQNMMNAGTYSNNTSGVKGVSRNGNLWCARIMVNYKQIFIGNFSDFSEAVKARKKAEIKYFGEFAFNYNEVSK